MCQYASCVLSMLNITGNTLICFEFLLAILLVLGTKLELCNFTIITCWKVKKSTGTV